MRERENGNNCDTKSTKVTEKRERERAEVKRHVKLILKWQKCY
jgi:hypothetical protein